MLFLYWRSTRYQRQHYSQAEQKQQGECYQEKTVFELEKLSVHIDEEKNRGNEDEGATDNDEGKIMLKFGIWIVDNVGVVDEAIVP